MAGPFYRFKKFTELAEEIYLGLEKAIKTATDRLKKLHFVLKQHGPLAPYFNPAKLSVG